MNHRIGVDFFHAFQYPVTKFLPGLHPDVPKKRVGHLSEKRLDDVEPGSMGGVSTYLNRFSLAARNSRVSWEMCAEWLSRINRIVHSAG